MGLISAPRLGLTVGNEYTVKDLLSALLVSSANDAGITLAYYVGGGDINSFIKKMNVKAKEVALFSALSQKIRDNEVFFIDEIKSEAGETKEMVAFLKAFEIAKSVLIVMDNSDEKVLRACANLQEVTTVPATLLSTYEVVRNAKIVMSKKAVEQIEEAYVK